MITAKPERIGAVGYWSGNVFAWAQPGSPYFSTITMCATHWWDGTQWREIYGDLPEQESENE